MWWLRSLWRIVWVMPSDEAAEWVDPAPMQARDEFARWCTACESPRSLHGGVRVCAKCDLVDWAPNGEHDATAISDDDLEKP